MEHAAIIDSTISFVRKTLENAEGGHDWWHIHRVWTNAKHIAQTEECDLLVVELAALLHDIADSKFHNGDEEIGPKTAGKPGPLGSTKPLPALAPMFQGAGEPRRSRFGQEQQ